MTDAAKQGRVYLVGAGPGDPGLLTLRGAECLAQAEVVLYDYLANPLLLDHAPSQATRICLGKHGHTRVWQQEEINQKMVDCAQAGQTVVRLKGGDPAIFAHLGSETAALRAHAIPFEVVPGITSALAVGSHAEIPLTHRDDASAVAFVTGKEAPGKAERMDYSGLARFPGTLVFYMGVTTASTWVQGLLTGGKPPETPVALVRRVSCADQQVIRCRLDEVVDRVTPRTKLPPPVLAVVGPAAARAPESSWFTNRHLFGQTILVTRAAHQAADLQRLLQEAGAQVRSQPAIEIGPPEDPFPLQRAIADVESFDWIVFSSRNGVNYFFDALIDVGQDARALHRASLAAIGPATAEALSEYALRADIVPETYRAESMVDSLCDAAAGKRFLLVRASRGREVLAEGLAAAGAEVTQVVAYSSRDIATADTEIVASLKAGHIDWTTVTSSAIARSLVQLFGDALRQTKLVSISPVTSATLRELGYEPAAEATSYTMEGVVAAIAPGQLVRSKRDPGP
ncbi:MAG: uroporphyrinogen-III C-methyltransferase [Planctomycetales bacterium]|nr:uroporphyrinogen-III C-methyltransferase [Planctomycetales bacterium]